MTGVYAKSPSIASDCYEILRVCNSAQEFRQCSDKTMK
jgi:hypothetical protein